MEARRFSDGDYEAVCDFLIALNRTDKTHINWNWARFEWMYGHPAFDWENRSKFGLWLDGGRVVGAAIYDMYFGEAFCAALPAYRSLYPEILAYAYRELRDDAGLAIAICDGNRDEIEAAKQCGFLPVAQDETILSIPLDRAFFAPLPAGFRFAEIAQQTDGEELGWFFWQGFDHGEDRAEFERQEQIAPRMRKHFRRELSVGVLDAEEEKAALCCLWKQDQTDYAYVEPVCTIPRYRGKGLAKAAIYEALNRAAAMGARTAYVISDMPFYRKLGFAEESHFTFYRKAL